MSIFHRQAYEAACDGKIPGGLTDEHFDNWNLLAVALDWMTPEQRCNAIYLDWLLQLDNPAHVALLQVRNLLIRQGAMAANYLAELAQNADDASDKVEAELRINLDGDWLFVSNNGRKVTSLNLLGLSRFFIHAGGGDQVDLSEETIGRFGIGFKSCYRIASQVFVFTWDAKGSFAFRLPICREGDPQSIPDPRRLADLQERLKGVGFDHLGPNLRDIKCLGYCTPEYAGALPQDLAARAGHHVQPPRGTLFCFHIRPDRLAEVRTRISGQAHEAYELCPLFLPYLTKVRFARHELQMRCLRQDAANDIPGTVTATRVELTTRSNGERPSTSRFWRLKGDAPGDVWQLALHADSEFRLKIEREDDEQGATIKDGAAYAFFPLNAVAWPLRLHLHLKLPTNLARDNWNPDDREQVEEQLARAVAGAAAWLERNASRQHPQWRIELLFTRKPNQTENWAWLIWQAILAECRTRRLLRTPWGSHVTAAQARTVELVEKEGARKAWGEFCSGLSGLTEEFPILNANGVLDFGLQELPEADLRRFFLKALDLSVSDESRRRLAAALFVVVNASPTTLETISDRLQIPFSDGSSATLGALMRRPAGSDLPDAWHDAFKSLMQLLWETPTNHGWTAVFEGQLRFHLKKLSERVRNYTWQQLPVALAGEAAWGQGGSDFWKIQREPCPAGLKRTVILCLRARDASNQWKPLTDYWLAHTRAPACFLGVLTSWAPMVGGNYDQLHDVEDKLQAWGLWEAWEDAVETKLRAELEAVSLRRLNAARIPAQLLEEAFGYAYDSSKANLPGRWRALVQDAEVGALKKFASARAHEIPSEVLLAADIPQDLRVILLLDRGFKLAPVWLTPTTIQRFQAAGAFGNRALTLLSLRDFDESRKRQVASMLLQEFHAWSAVALTAGQARALDELCGATPPTLRGNWAIGLTPRLAVLLKDMVNPSTASSERPHDSNPNQPLLLSPQTNWLRIRELPQLLRQIPAVSGACLQAHELRAQITTGGPPLPIPLEQVAGEVLADPLCQQLLANSSGSVMACKRPINIQWFRDGEIVAELLDAPFALKDECLLFCRAETPGETTQYREILSLYSLKGRSGEHFQRFQQLWQAGERSHEELYAEFRDRILTTLLQTEVHDLGYQPHHVARELLQNAESAYDSLPPGVPMAGDFKLISLPAPERGGWETTAEHAGRQFNQPLPSGEARDDIRLIVSIPTSEQPPTEGWVGRFNRGFKSIFTITKSVKITSGPFAFTVLDMLLLNPPKPQPNQEPPSSRTTFAFRSSRTDVLRLFKVASLEINQPPLALFDCSSFVFLRHINLALFQLDKWRWQWAVERRPHRSGWTEIQVTQAHPAKKETFLVSQSEVGARGHSRSSRFGVAVRLSGNAATAAPERLAPEQRRIRLTFETEDSFPLDFIVNGDFETDSGRLGIRQSAVNEAILVACLRQVKDLCIAELGRLNDINQWQAWTEVLHLASGEAELSAHFETHHGSLVREFQAAAEFLCGHVPHNGTVADAKDLRYPSPLLRKVVRFVQSWGFPVQDWIAPKVEAQLPKAFLEKRRRLGLPDLLQEVTKNPSLRERILQDLQSQPFRTAHGPLDAVASGELSRAKELLAGKETPMVPPPASKIWTVAELWAWWNKNGKPASEYTLEGTENWPLLFPDADGDLNERRARLSTALRDVGSDEGKSLWYRLFGLACLMSAGRRTTELRNFWQGELHRRRFWERTGRASFGEGTDDLFAEVVTQPFSDLAASGEHAYFWRRVFYDIRKIHKLVWEHDFPATILDLLKAGQGENLLNFLRSGHLRGQPSWTGVFGQSAGSPLFFLVRELCRLEVIKDPAVKPFAFFVCTPVRRAMERIGWLPEGYGNWVDFESLASLSKELHSRITADNQCGAKLLEYYDIPLLHLGLEG